MFQLPKNEPQVPKDTPRNYFIYGETMSGKSYLANEFPSPIVLNTDGNAEANSVPSIQLKNDKDRTGEITKSVIDQLSEILLALQTQSHTYKTVIIDVIDDVLELMRIAVANQLGVKSLSEAGYGKGYDYYNQAITELVMDLKALPMNVIYISRQINEYDDEGKVTKEIPSLKPKFVNLINGNSDLMIQTLKVGNNYSRKIDRRRKAYKADQVDDSKILSILKTIRGALDSATAKTTQQDKF
ncbi:MULTISPECIES: AAA family ATPase [Lactobacillales]|uniref:AAA family ATPase n=1 Tax=Lactobacillales TaxID=186826 RepID=UPI001F0F2550|nr:MULTISPECIES: AAA family ATPase [Lactobacillales]MCT0448077.1 NTP-binding protein [Lactococcus lactis subsp. lactis]MDN6009001.1 ATP-binding protein [Lactobacillus sp.]MDN6544862.1 ATP-binding protein [Enterococcaceae bacterium]UMU17981.1 AAA family ATPase [Lactococcus lactis subsp. lactis]